MSWQRPGGKFRNKKDLSQKDRKFLGLKNVKRQNTRKRYNLPAKKFEKEK